MSTKRNIACSLWLVLDHFWLVLRCNLLALLLILPIVTGPLAIAGMLHVSSLLVAKRQARMTDFAKGMRLLGGRMYVLAGILLGFWIWTTICFFLYGRQTGILQPIGVTATIVLALTGNVLAVLLLPGMARGWTWGQSLCHTARWILEQPAKILSFFAANAIVEGLLLLSGIGFLAFGLIWPIFGILLFFQEYRYLRFGEPPYQEERSFKDIVLPDCRKA